MLPHFVNINGCYPMNKFESSCAENPCSAASSSVRRKRITLVKNEAVPPKALKEALAHVRKGGKLLVTTSFRGYPDLSVEIINKHC